jgi:glycogen debranching enzyme
MHITDEAREHALTVLRHCAKKTGFYASGLPGGYEATWARDSMITSLGAAFTGKEFEPPFRKSLELLSKHQSVSGQIPNAVGTWNKDRQSDVTFNTVDSSLWYIIGEHVYRQTFGSWLSLRGKKNIQAAYGWLKHQDPNEVGFVAQQPTMDWQDAFPHKYGHTISTQALWYAALNILGEKKRAEHLKKVVNGDVEKYLALYDKKLGYYLPWNWKNHDGDREEERWFDSFGNIMAIVTGLATPKIASSILRYIEREKIDRPFPVKAIWPPIKPGDKEWHSYFDKCDARTPLEYLNGGVWPMIGGFYVVALVKVGKHAKAKKALEALALANRKGKDRRWGFQEWLHGKTGQAIGNSEPYQAWSAGAYLYAYECVRRGKVLFFS